MDLQGDGTEKEFDTMDTMDNPIAEGFDEGEENSGAMSPRSDGDMSPRLTAAEAAQLKSFAENYQADYIKSVHSSLICIFGKQRDDFHTLSTFQDLITKQWPKPEQLQALYSLAQNVPPEVVDAVLWLWCGGQGVPLEVNRYMVNFDAYMSGHEHYIDCTVKSAKGGVSFSILFQKHICNKCTEI